MGYVNYSRPSQRYPTLLKSEKSMVALCGVVYQKRGVKMKYVSTLAQISPERL